MTKTDAAPHLVVAVLACPLPLRNGRHCLPIRTSPPTSCSIAPPCKEPILRTGDRLAICGDSITEQKMYSRIMETYLTACAPQWQVTVRQFG